MLAWDARCGSQFPVLARFPAVLAAVVEVETDDAAEPEEGAGPDAEAEPEDEVRAAVVGASWVTLAGIESR